MVKINIKWNRQSFKDIDLSGMTTGVDLKQHLCNLTGVPVNRQKIMGVGKGLLKDDQLLSGLKIKDGQMAQLMGTAEKLPEPPKEKVVFAEDIAKEGHTEDIMQKLPMGLVNRGNTCYLNASVQALRTIPELRNNLNKVQFNQADLHGKIVNTLKEVYHSLDSQRNATAPDSLIMAFRQAYPQFAEKQSTPMGEVYEQQDAEEFITSLMASLTNQLDSHEQTRGLIDKLFRGQFHVRMELAEPGVTEEPTETTEPFSKLSCFIQQDTNNVQYGVEKSLVTSLDKRSPTLNRDATYTKTQRINRLPPYLNTNMVRFFWKQREQVKAKILKDVKFSMVLDLYELCTDDLKAKLKVKRDALRMDKEKKLMEQYSSSSSSSSSDEKKKEEGEEDGDMKMDEASESDVKKQKTVASSSDSSSSSSSSEDEDELENTTGWYELFAIVSHQGRTANSGHYVGWVKDDEYDRWLKFDDDKVSVVSEDKIKSLSGGGDFHMAYELLYRKMDEAP